ncbi:MAG: hypothetical protein NVSMB37_0820 [Candidatus Saccharimonadales bacterium]
MYEYTQQTFKRFEYAVIASGLALSACTPARPSIRETNATVTESLENANNLSFKDALVVGDRLSRIKIITPSLSRHETIDILASSDQATEDLAVVYSPEQNNLDRYQLANGNNNIARAYLLSYSEGRIAVGDVYFNSNNMRILDFSPPHIISEPVTLFDFRNTSDSTIMETKIVPRPDHRGVTISFDVKASK